MKYRALDQNGDYVLNNSQAFLTETQAVAQAIKTRLNLLSGEWWEDVQDGLPLWQDILGAPATPDNLLAIDQVIQNRISGTTGIQSIDSFTSSYDSKTRAYSYQSIVTTIYSTTIPVNGSLT